MLFLLFLRRSKSRNLILVFDIIQLIFVPLIMLFCGFILLFQGWRLDPILQFVQFLLFILITYLLIKDIVFSTIDRK
ncbi:Ycf66 family protein [Anabaena sp. PCC 7938]